MNPEGYRLIDEQSPPLYSGRALRICTFFFSPVGLTMALVNAGRSGRTDLRPKILLAFLLYTVAYVVVSYVRVRYVPPESQRILRVLNLALGYALGLYYENLFAPVLEAHLGAGGRLASAWLPTLVILALVALMLGVALWIGGAPIAPR